jgi:uncharacterized membrane protein
MKKPWICVWVSSTRTREIKYGPTISRFLFMGTLGLLLWEGQTISRFLSMGTLGLLLWEGQTISRFLSMGTLGLLLWEGQAISRFLSMGTLGLLLWEGQTISTFLSMGTLGLLLWEGQVARSINRWMPQHTQPYICLSSALLDLVMFYSGKGHLGHFLRKFMRIMDN